MMQTEQMTHGQELTSFLHTASIFQYKPHGTMEGFVQGTDRRSIVRAANRSGKTLGAAYKLSKYMLENPGCRCRVVGPNYKQVVDVASRYLYDFLGPWLSPESHYSITRGFSNQVFILKNGSLCQLRTNEQDVNTFAGDSLDVCWFDEVPEQNIFVENLARVMDRQGAVWITCTPVGREVTWLKETVETDIWQQYVIPFSLDACPWYTEVQVEGWIKECRLDPMTYEQRINAAWEGATVNRRLIGLTKDNFFEALPLYDYRVLIGIDHGELAGNQVACLVLHATTKDQLYLLDEYVSQRGTTPQEDAYNIAAMLKKNDLSLYDVDKVVGDINTGGKQSPGTSVNRLITEGFAKVLNIPVYQLPDGLRVRKPDKRKGSVDFGERMINVGLMDNKLHISEQCTKYKKALQHYNGQAHIKHYIDALRYIVSPIFETQHNDYISRLMIKN